MSARTLLKKILALSGYELFSTKKFFAQDGLFTLHNDHFRRDPNFRAAYARGVRASRGVDPSFEWRVHVALWAAMHALKTEGAFVECGVNAGFMSSAIMHRLDWSSAGRTFFLIDTFNGPLLSQYTQDEIKRGRLKIAEDALAAGAYVTDLQRVRDNYSEWSNVEIIQGAVPDVLGQTNIRDVAFLHIDMNCAYPERAAFEFFWPRLSPGGVVLLDDYAYLGHDQQAVAIDSVASVLGAEILSLPTGQGLVMK